jgi:hypothetical protein
MSGPIFVVGTSPVCRLIVALGKLWQTRPLLERRSQQARDSSSPGLLGLAAPSLRRWRKHAVPDERLPAEQWLLLLVAPALLGRLRRRRRCQPRGRDSTKGGERKQERDPGLAQVRLGSARREGQSSLGRDGANVKQRGGPGWAAARRGDP